MTDDKYSNKEIAELLRNVAAAYILKGEKENRFRIIAYEKAADGVEHLSRELRDVWQDGKLIKFPVSDQVLDRVLRNILKAGSQSTLTKY